MDKKIKPECQVGTLLLFELRDRRKEVVSCRQPVPKYLTFGETFDGVWGGVMMNVESNKNKKQKDGKSKAEMTP